jgi:hypothetical protein
VDRSRGALRILLSDFATAAFFNRTHLVNKNTKRNKNVYSTNEAAPHHFHASVLRSRAARLARRRGTCCLSFDHLIWVSRHYRIHKQSGRVQSCNSMFFVVVLLCLLNVTFAKGVCLFILLAPEHALPFCSAEQLRDCSFVPALPSLPDAAGRALAAAMLAPEADKRCTMDQVQSHPFLLVMEEVLRTHH